MRRRPIAVGRILVGVVVVCVLFGVYQSPAGAQDVDTQPAPEAPEVDPQPDPPAPTPFVMPWEVDLCWWWEDCEIAPGEDFWTDIDEWIQSQYPPGTDPDPYDEVEPDCDSLQPNDGWGSYLSCWGWTKMHGFGGGYEPLSVMLPLADNDDLHKTVFAGRFRFAQAIEWIDPGATPTAERDWWPVISFGSQSTGWSLGYQMHDTPDNIRWGMYRDGARSLDSAYEIAELQERWAGITVMFEADDDDDTLAANIRIVFDGEGTDTLSLNDSQLGHMNYGAAKSMKAKGSGGVFSSWYRAPNEDDNEHLMTHFASTFNEAFHISVLQFDEPGYAPPIISPGAEPLPEAAPAIPVPMPLPEVEPMELPAPDPSPEFDPTTGPTDEDLATRIRTTIEWLGGSLLGGIDWLGQTLLVGIDFLGNTLWTVAEWFLANLVSLLGWVVSSLGAWIRWLGELLIHAILVLIQVMVSGLNALIAIGGALLAMLLVLLDLIATVAGLLVPLLQYLLTMLTWLGSVLETYLVYLAELLQWVPQAILQGLLTLLVPTVTPTEFMTRAVPAPSLDVPTAPTILHPLTGFAGAPPPGVIPGSVFDPGPACGPVLTTPEPVPLTFRFPTPSTSGCPGNGPGGARTAADNGAGDAFGYRVTIRNGIAFFMWVGVLFVFARAMPWSRSKDDMSTGFATAGSPS